MTTFGQSLREQVTKGLLPQADKNPLRTIGLSRSILELGLSDDELYRYCQNMARSLMAQFHPDRRGDDPTIVEYQRRFSEAFNALDRREVFDQALREFKHELNEEKSARSYARNEERIQNDQLDEMRTMLNRSQTSVKNATDQLQEMKERFVSHLLLRSASLGEALYNRLGVTGIQQAVRINLLKIDVYTPCVLPSPSVVRRYVQEYQDITQRKKWTMKLAESFQGRLIGDRVGGGKVADLVSQALDEDELFPVVYWSSTEGFKKLGITRFRVDDHRRPVSTPDPVTRLPITRLSDLYRQALASLGAFMQRRTEGVESLSVRLESVAVKLGSYGERVRTYPMLGSLRLEDSDPLSFYHMGMSHVPQKTVVENLQPLLIPGAFLVTQTNPRLTRIKKVGTGRDSLNQVGDKLTGFSVPGVILEVIPGDFD